MSCCFFFFFKQKTAYEMRISDWSSDVCSSDLLGWSLNISDGLEIDEYDDERAMYAIAFDVEGKVAISGRFRPADDRSMLVDHFAHVLPADIGPINKAKTLAVSRALSIENGQLHNNLPTGRAPFREKGCPGV